MPPSNGIHVYGCFDISALKNSLDVYHCYHFLDWDRALYPNVRLVKGCPLDERKSHLLSSTLGLEANQGVMV